MTVTDLLQQLVRIPSVNPDNSPGTDRTGEKDIADFLAAWLREIGADVTLDEIRPGRPNLIARFAPLDGRPRILLGPHLDTVGVGGMTIDPFAAEIRDGKIWGRGTSDTKGPMAAMLWGLKQNAAALKDSPVAIDFVGFMGEESSQWGSIQFGKTYGKDYQFAIVGEPTSLDVVNTTKGSLWATLRAKGKAAHSSQPERGENAVMKLARSLDQLEQELIPKLASFTHPILGHSTMNIGVFHGGSRPNIVPDHAEAEVDIRITPSLTEAGGALALIQKSLAGQDIEILAPVEKPPMETPADNPWIKRILAVKPDSKTVGAPWFSDASHLSEVGIPSICMGPGSIDQAHTKDEFIRVSDLEQGADFFDSLIRDLSHPIVS
ncbi:M20 family metallopeptidase [Haloferula chungangensis]|uniref:M20 family metallopeptidase n=1 Tax=Haloferula chungangensis TaxID=1048331 RepID=A0ABW2L293_9BACT